jgi:hypothetical protein
VAITGMLHREGNDRVLVMITLHGWAALEYTRASSTLIAS